MNIFNVPEGFWEEHALLYVTLITSLVLNVAFVSYGIVSCLIGIAERREDERLEIIEQVVRRVKREMKQKEREKK